MSDTTKEETGREGAERFAEESRRESPSMIAEYWSFLRHNRKWWLLPVILSLLAVGLIVVIGGTVAAPFIYSLF